MGTGMGQYGFLARTNLENVNLFEVDGSIGKQRPKSEWRVTIDGIEGFEGYRTPVHDYAYNTMYFGDAIEVLPSLDDKYDLVMAIDILEHFDMEDGYLFLEALKRVSSGVVLVSTPKLFIEQEVEANPFEDHRSLWTQEDLAKVGFSQIIENDESWIAVFTATE